VCTSQQIYGFIDFCDTWGSMATPTLHHDTR